MMFAVWVKLTMLPWRGIKVKMYKDDVVVFAPSGSQWAAHRLEAAR